MKTARTLPLVFSFVVQGGVGVGRVWGVRRWAHGHINHVDLGMQSPTLYSRSVMPASFPR